MTGLLKATLKFIFPAIFLKRLFLAYNKLKIETLDRLFYPVASIHDDAFQINKTKNPFIELNVPIQHLSAEVQKGFALWQQPAWVDDEYIVLVSSDGCIEPKIGWALTGGNRLIAQSLGLSKAPHIHKPGLFNIYIRKHTTIHIKKVISLRDPGEENYFHFFNDVLAKLFFLEDHGIDLKECVIVVSESLWQKPYFQYYRNHQRFRKLNWFVQTKEWIRFEQGIFCKPFTHTLKYLEAAAAMAPSFPAEGRKIFLTRSKESLRYVENMEELRSLLESSGFEIVDTSKMLFLDQVELFSKTSHIIAIHGAGMTNLIFGKGGKVLELFPPTSSNYLPFHYVMLSKLKGFTYNALIGEKGQANQMGGFCVNVESLKKYLLNEAGQ